LKEEVNMEFKKIRKDCEELWAKNKYYVLSKSHKGYFKNEATEIEKQGLCNLLQEYMKGKNNQKSVIEYINILLKKYPNEYLQKSTLLKGEEDETLA